MSPDGANSRGAFTGSIAVVGTSAELATKHNKTFCIEPVLSNNTGQADTRCYLRELGAVSDLSQS